MVKETMPQSVNTLFSDIRFLIESTQSQVAHVVNTGLVMLYWQVGKRILKGIKQNKRAEYGKQVVESLSQQLVQEYGHGFSRPNLFRMVKFAESFSDTRIVSTLSRQLGWSHFVEILSIREPLKRDFYAEMCRIERWSVRTLKAKIQGMLFERTAISRRPAQLAKKELTALREADKITPNLVFRDPYLLDFLGLKNTYAEKDLESAILRELESFIMELGSDFSFVARQKRITIDHEDYYIDLLFYHRRMKRLVVVELKLGKFKAADKGQMELYLRWLDKHERREGEESPLGLILCAETTSEHIELLQLHESGIRVAEYLTELPPRRLLKKKLHEAINAAREADRKFLMKKI